MGVTLKDVAARSGVSVRTACEVLGGPRAHLYAATTREKVRLAAQTLGYRRNHFARAVRLGRFGAVGLLVPAGTLGNLPPGLLSSIDSTLNEQGMILIVAHQSAMGADVPLLQELAIDGLLVDHRGQIQSPALEFVYSYPVPLVHMNAQGPVDCVFADALAAAREATEYLLGLGHRRIAFLDTEHHPFFTLADLATGYRQAMAAAGLKAHCRILPVGEFGDLRKEVAYQEVRHAAIVDWFRSKDRPTAVIASISSDAMLVQTSALRMGLQFPRDLSLVTFSDWIVNQHGQPITTLFYASHELGEISVNMLLERIRRPEAIPSRTVPYRLVEGCTTGPAAGADPVKRG